MKTAFIVFLISGIFIAYYAIAPISEEQAYIRANDELSYFCTDMGFECNMFHSPVLAIDENHLRIYEWQESGNPSRITQVRVPYQRIGDLTFGLIGKDVTLGSYEK